MSTLKITKVSGYALSSPFGGGPTLGHALGVKSVGLVEVHTDSGLIGIGETYAGVYAPDLIAPTAAFLNELLVGEDPFEDDVVGKKLDRLPYIGRNGLVRSVGSALDVALWDIRGKHLDKPVRALLRASSTRPIRAYASGGSARMSPEEVAQDAADVVEAGFSAYKMRVGYQSWQQDLARVAAARKILGEERELMVDAIMGTIHPPWPASTAIDRSHDLEPFHPAWLEEPVSPYDFDGLAAVHAAANVPIATGEALCGEDEFARVLAGPIVDVVQPDVTHCGGITPAMSIARASRDAGVQMAVHVWGSGVALAANTHFAFGSGHVTHIEVPLLSLALTDEMREGSPELSEGHIQPPEEPGLGVSITEAMKEKYPYVSGSRYQFPRREGS